MKKENLLLILLIALAILTRFYKLGEMPVAIFRDETALTYNAYSILQTGKDEYGKAFPIVFRSFEVFFLPVYVYLTAGVIYFLGLSEFSSRFLSALGGVFLVIFAYLISVEIFKDKRVGLFSALVLTFAPIYLIYSRGTFEGNLALTFFAGGFYFLLKYLKKEQLKFLYLSGFLFVTCMYTYHAERFVTAVFGVIALIILRKQLFKLKLKLLYLLIFLTVLFLPLLSLSLQAGGSHRALGVSIFTEKREPPGYTDGKNEIFLRGRQFLALYTSYFSPRNIFFEGDANKQRSVVDYGAYFGFYLPFLLLGIYYLTKNFRTEQKLFLSWILIAPLPAALTTDPFHTYRSLLLYFPLGVLVGLGLFKVYEQIKFKRIYLGILGLFLFINLGLFGFNYTVITQALHGAEWDYGYKEIVKVINEQKDYEKIIIDDPMSEAYINYLFLNKVDPASYQDEVLKSGLLKESEYYTDAEEKRPNRFKNIEFRPVDWPAERGDYGKLMVIKADRLPESEYKGDANVRFIKLINYLDGTPAFRVVQIFDHTKVN